MSSYIQVFRHNRTATGAKFSGIPGVNLYHRTASFFRFTAGELYKLTPGYVTNAFVNPMVAVRLHLLNVEFFKDDQTETVDQLPAFLVSKVRAPILDTGMDVVQNLNSLAAFWRSLVEFRYLALDTFQVGFVTLQEAWVRNRFASTEGCEFGQANVNTYNFRGWRKRFRFNGARKTSIPVAKSITLDSQGANLTLDRPVKDYLNITYLGDTQPITNQFKARLLEGEAIVPAITLKAWKAGLVTGLDPTKESLESQVYPLLNVLQYLGMNVSEFWPFGFPAGQHLVGIIQAQRLLFLFPRIFTQGQRVVIDLAAKFKGLVQLSTLCLGWIKTILKSFTHCTLLRKLYHRISVLSKHRPDTAKSRTVGIDLNLRKGKPLYPLVKTQGLYGLIL
jgi:hypothetical protein